MEVEFSTSKVEIALGVSAPESVEMSYSPEYRGPYGFEFGGDHGFLDPSRYGISSPYALHLVATIQHRRYRARTVTATQLPDGAPVGAGELARIPVVTMLEAIADVVPLLVFVRRGEWDLDTAPAIADNLQRQLSGAPGDPYLTAQLYRVLKLTHQKPTAEMAARMGVNDVTVRRWLASAVKQSMLDASERGR